LPAAAKAGSATSARQGFPRAAAAQLGGDPSHRRNAATDGGAPPADGSHAPASRSKNDHPVDNRGLNVGKGNGKSVRFTSNADTLKQDKENERNKPRPPPGSSCKKAALDKGQGPLEPEVTEQRSASKQRLEALTMAVDRAAPATPFNATSSKATPLRPTPSRSSSGASRTPISLLNSELDLVEKRTGGSFGGRIDDSLLVSPEPSQARMALRRRFPPTSGGKSLTVASKKLPPKAAREPSNQGPNDSNNNNNTVRQRVRGSVPLRIDTNAPPLEDGETQGPSHNSLTGTKTPLLSVHGPCNHKEMAIQWHHDVIHAVASPAEDSTTPSGGVCLDLSGMFCNVASDFKRPPKPQLSVPPSRAKPWKRPTLQASSATAGTGPAPGASALLPPPHPFKSAKVEVATVEHTSSHAANLQNEEWSEKLCDIFTQWLNLMLQPTIIDADSYAMDNPSAMRTLRAHQQMTSTRLKALQLFNDQPMRHARDALRQEIRSGKLSLRKDQNLAANLSLRDQVISLLFQYSTPWLRLGLETIFGEAILPHDPHHVPTPKHSKAATPFKGKSNPGSLKLAIRRFIVQRVLADEATLVKFSKRKCAVPSGRFELEYQSQLREVVLFRLLGLFFFLDAAKQAELIENVTLFRRDSSIKSSKNVLLSFCRDFLSSEGNFLKHLAKVGLSVSFEQDRIEEIELGVTNLAVDLKDGVNLSRLAEIITGVPNRSIMSTLRLPARSRLQKLHNVGVALDHLHPFLESSKDYPAHRRISAHHVVDGHRDVVLKLLWIVLAECCLDKLVNLQQIQDETRKLERLYFPSASFHNRMDATLPPSPALKDLLLRWCSAVSRSFGLELRNLTTDFADGKAFCYVISYYHPLLLRLRLIKRSTRDLPRHASEEQRRIALSNERSNALLANSRMNDLGGLSRMIPLCDSTSPPDEKTVVLCLSFLWSRLIETKGEIRSSVVIQTSYRNYRARVLLRRQQDASRLIFREWQNRKEDYYLAQKRRYGRSVRVLERFVLTHRIQLAQLREHRLHSNRLTAAAIVVQVRFIAYFGTTVSL
jgi:CAMSAP CH domain